MRAISLWQPHASAVALLAKLNETRGWATDYRGPLAIHAAARCNLGELKAYREDRAWQAALAGTALVGVEKPNFHTCLPFGAVIAVCDVMDCRLVEKIPLAEIRTPRERRCADGEMGEWTEEQMGLYKPERFAWSLANIHPLTTPLPYRGCQRFFDVPDYLLTPLLPPGVVVTSEPQMTAEVGTTSFQRELFAPAAGERRGALICTL